MLKHELVEILNYILVNGTIKLGKPHSVTKLKLEEELGGLTNLNRPLAELNSIGLIEFLGQGDQIDHIVHLTGKGVISIKEHNEKILCNSKQNQTLTCEPLKIHSLVNKENEKQSDNQLIPKTIWELIISIFWANILGKIVLGLIVIGLVLFAIWNSLTDKQKNELLEMGEEEKVEYPYRYDLITVEQRVENIDLSLQRNIPLNLQDKKISPVKRTLKLTLTRNSSSCVVHRRFVYTTGLPPEIVCFSHPYEIIEEEYTNSPDKKNRKKYQINFDIKAEPLEKPFEIDYQIITWNAFQEGNKYSGALIKHETELLEYSVSSPKKFNHFDFYKKDYETLSRTEIDISNYFVNADSTILTIKLEKPRSRYAYIIDWEK
ncbi:MAG: hypothetical protein ACPGSD_14770 [Flavobacteriales bacterium]